MSTSTPVGDSARYQALRQFTGVLSNAAGSPTAAASAGQVIVGDAPAQVQAGDYLVGVVNRTSEVVVHHMLVRYILTDSPKPRDWPIIDVNLEPGKRVNLKFPDSCSDMEAYVVVSFIGPVDKATLFHTIPADGVMTPERSSQDNPDDPGPCSDVWPVTDPVG
jgi:hypothetical protein